MPFPRDYDYDFAGPVKVELASSQVSNYFSDFRYGPLKQAPGSPFPLRATVPNGHRPVGPAKLASSSILGMRHSRTRHSIERSDSTGDNSASGDSDDGGSAAVIYSRHRSHYRPKNWNVRIAPILRNFLVQQLDSSKKRVKFADDFGYALEEVFFFAEDFDFWEPEPLSVEDRLIEAAKADEQRKAADHSQDLVVEISEWQVNFSQPAADYVGFRNRLESLNVGLENVIIKKNSSTFMGTVRVKNVSFRKDVFIRCSFNNWETFVDFPAKYCANAAAHSNQYDTFSFEIAIPPEAEDRHSVEFCVGFRTNGAEFWDNNSGKNYQLITSTMKSHRELQRHEDAYVMKNIDPKFASWQQLDTARPYW